MKNDLMPALVLPLVALGMMEAWAAAAPGVQLQPATNGRVRITVTNADAQAIVVEVSGFGTMVDF